MNVTDYRTTSRHFALEASGSWQAGDVVRNKNQDMLYPFSDHVILGFSEDGQARVSRPYLYASGVGTTGPIPLLGCETYELSVNALTACYDKIGRGRTTR